jgi:hypothetical protein
MGFDKLSPNGVNTSMCRINNTSGRTPCPGVLLTFISAGNARPVHYALPTEGVIRVNVSQTGKSLFASLALFAFPFLCAHADDFDSWSEYGYADGPVRTKPGFQAVQRLGFTLGGDPISKITYPDGVIREISAGGLNQIGLGILYQWDVIPFSVALTLNYHYDSDYNENDNASFRRVPLEALAYFNGPGRFRIGAGTRYVYSARAASTINGVTEKITFKDTMGSVVEIGYQVRPYGWVSLRYVKETYEVETYSTSGTTPALSGNTPYNGSHTGLFVSYEY